MQPKSSIHGCSSGGTAWLVSWPAEPVRLLAEHHARAALRGGQRGRHAAEPAAHDQDVGSDRRSREEEEPDLERDRRDQHRADEHDVERGDPLPPALVAHALAAQAAQPRLLAPGRAGGIPSSRSWRAPSTPSSLISAKLVAPITAITANTAPMLRPDVPWSREPTHSASSGLPVQMFTAMTAIAARSSALLEAGGHGLRRYLAETAPGVTKPSRRYSYGMPALFLSIAIVAEVAGTVALKYTDGFTKLGPTAVVVVGYGLSFWMLALVLRDLPIGLTYAVWAAVGTALIAAIGIVAFGEPATTLKLLSLGLIIAGVVGLNLAGSH